MRKKVAIMLVFVLLVTLLCSCSSVKDGKKKVNIGFFPNLTHSQALLGKAQGEFSKSFGEEYEINWIQFNAGSAEIEALKAGEIDIGYIGPGPAINGYISMNGDVQIIAGANDAGAILVTRSDLKLNSIKELSGKKVAIPQLGNTQDLMLRNLLLQNNLTDASKGGTVEIMQINNPDIKIQFDKKEIDAALVPEPWGSRLVKEANANVMLDYDAVWRNGKYPTTLVIARKEIIDNNPEIIEKFLNAHIKLTQNLMTNSSTYEDTINLEMKNLTNTLLSKDILDSSFKRMTPTLDPEKDAIIELVKLSISLGTIKGNPNMDNLFNLEILNKLLKQKGLKQIK